ncbi:hypothetical protein PFLmoz3_05938 [Pseudomonas fluorescens]|uniref:Uncharacterized protein n=1 Tax=Pseudomonas fluorescens TaxID=294 RepID=A0A109LBI3_PSEFL|nr:hypothetical protein PFLmoz3_05938 [Pseudomonas fluorescens]
MLLWAVVDQLEQIAASVVAIGLTIVSHGSRILEMSRPAISAAGLPAGGFDQLVKTVVGIAVDRLDALVGKEAHRQCLVFKAKDIAHRVIDVVQIL